MASVPAGKQVQGIDLRENRTWAMRQDSSGSTLAKIAGLAGEHRLIVLEGPAAGESSPQDTVTEETVTVWEVDMTNGHAQRLGTLTLPGPSDYAQLVRPAGVDAHHLYVYARGGSGSGTLTAYRLP